MTAILVALEDGGKNKYELVTTARIYLRTSADSLPSVVDGWFGSISVGRDRQKTARSFGSKVSTNPEAVQAESALIS
jgi:hypothetical protein